MSYATRIGGTWGFRIGLGFGVRDSFKDPLRDLVGFRCLGRWMRSKEGGLGGAFHLPPPFHPPQGGASSKFKSYI